jgi:hypothetical protein
MPAVENRNQTGEFYIYFRLRIFFTKHIRMGGTVWDLEFLNGLGYVMGRLQGRVQERVRELRKRWKRMEITRDISRCLERDRGR